MSWQIADYSADHKLSSVASITSNQRRQPHNQAFNDVWIMVETLFAFPGQDRDKLGLTKLDGKVWICARLRLSKDNIFEKSLSMTSCRRDFVSSYVEGFTWKEFVTLSSNSVKISQYLHLSPLAALHPSLILSFDLHCGASSPPLWPPGSTWWEVARRRQAARPALAHSFAGLRGSVREDLDTMRGCVMNVGDRCRRWTSPICFRFIHPYTLTTVDSTNSPQESLSLLVPQIQVCFISLTNMFHISLLSGCWV